MISEINSEKMSNAVAFKIQGCLPFSNNFSATGRIVKRIEKRKYFTLKEVVRRVLASTQRQIRIYRSTARPTTQQQVAQKAISRCNRRYTEPWVTSTISGRTTKYLKSNLPVETFPSFLFQYFQAFQDSDLFLSKFAEILASLG